MKVGWYFARAVAGWFFGLCAVTCALLVAWLSLVPTSTQAMPSPWSLVGPLFLVATGITWARARRTGELAAAAAGGAGLATCVPVAAVGVVLQVLFAIPEGRMPGTRAFGAPIQRSVDGSLFLSQAARGVLLLPSGEVRIVAARPPAEFKPAPHNPQRYRRQAFFSSAPRFAPREPLDPWWWRWVYTVLVLGVPTMLMRAQRGWLWAFGVLPLSLPLLVL